MHTYVLSTAASPLRFVTGEPEKGLFDALPLWLWVAIGVALLLIVAFVIVLVLGRDRSHSAEVARAYRTVVRSSPLSKADRRLLASGAKEAAVEPVACLLCVGAFDRVLVGVPQDFAERFSQLRARLFPEASPLERTA